MAVRAAAAQEFPSLVQRLDVEFVFGKGRDISLAQRFPGIYASGGAGGLLLAEADGAIRSVLACRHFDWQCDGRDWRGAMVGAVYTDPLWRGHGFASRLLESVTAELPRLGADFAVLWTTRPAWYSRLGWLAADCGMLGETVQRPGTVRNAGETTRMPIAAADLGRIEQLRTRWTSRLVRRNEVDYRCLPLPAEAMEALIWDDGGERAAYALIGSTNAWVMLYEMIGHPDGFRPLWTELGRGSKRLMINESLNSPARHWLAANTDVSWQEKPLAMWLSLSQEVDLANFGHWYIPYLDRI